MIKTIFRNIFLVGLLVLVICAVVFFGLQYTQTVDETFAALKQETSYAITGLGFSGTEFLDALDDTNRITWIDRDGSVIFDSEYRSSVPNQRSCAEVSAAFQTGEGQATRRSDSSGHQTMYYAKQLEDGSVLRLSRPVRAVWYALVTVSPVLWVLVLVLLISGVLAFRAAKQIVTPINDLDLENHSTNPYPELSPLLDKIEEQKLLIQEEASLREEMRREFSANVSHELKTPLTSISGFAELMAQGTVSADKVTEFSGDIYRESLRLIALIDDIIKLSRLDEESDLPPREQIDIRQLASDVADHLRPVADKNNISLEVKGEPVYISGVYQLLYEMVYNMCDNSVKYNYPGGKVLIQVDRAGDRAKLTVSDTGIGIPKEHQKRVFERFYRVDKSHSREIGGTGLGLSIVKHGALYHNADIDMESESGKGTRITLTFPTDEPDRPELTD